MPSASYSDDILFMHVLIFVNMAFMCAKALMQFHSDNIARNKLVWHALVQNKISSSSVLHNRWSMENDPEIEGGIDLRGACLRTI